MRTETRMVVAKVAVKAALLGNPLLAGLPVSRIGIIRAAPGSDSRQVFLSL